MRWSASNYLLMANKSYFLSRFRVVLVKKWVSLWRRTRMNWCLTLEWVCELAIIYYRRVRNQK